METILNNQDRAKSLITCLYISLAASGISIALGLYEYSILSSINSGSYVSDDMIDLNDALQGLNGVISLVFVILLAVKFTQWFRRAYKNLQRLGMETEYTDGMAFWGFVIPIMSLFVPFKIAKEIWIKSQEEIQRRDPSYEPDRSTEHLWIWWLPYLISSFAGNVAARSLFGGDSIGELISANIAYLISDMIGVISVFTVIAMIRKTNKVEQVLYALAYREPGFDDQPPVERAEMN